MTQEQLEHIAEFVNNQLILIADESEEYDQIYSDLHEVRDSSLEADLTLKESIERIYNAINFLSK